MYSRIHKDSYMKDQNIKCITTSPVTWCKRLVFLLILGDFIKRILIFHV